MTPRDAVVLPPVEIAAGTRSPVVFSYVSGEEAVDPHHTPSNRSDVRKGFALAVLFFVGMAYGLYRLVAG